jgi:predicted ATPase
LFREIRGAEFPKQHSIDRQGPTTSYYDALAKKITQLEQAPLRFETFLSQLPKMFTEPENLSSRLTQVTYYGAYALNVGPKSPLRLPQKMQPTESIKMVSI